MMRRSWGDGEPHIQDSQANAGEHGGSHPRKIELYAADRAALANNVTKLQGRDGCRLRVNDRRVIFDEDGSVLAILAIGPRGGIHDREVAAYDRVRRPLASGEDEMLHSAVADRLLAGGNPIKVWREHRGLTSAALAAKADIRQGFLSQIETGKRAGTIGTLSKIAAALRVSIDDLVASREAPKEAQAIVADKIEGKGPR